MEPLSPSTLGSLEAGGWNTRSCIHIRLVSIFLIPHLFPSYSTMIKYSNYLFHGRSSMPFILSMNSRDTIQTCTFLIHKTSVQINLWYHNIIFFFDLKHILLLISRTLLCNGSLVCNLHFKPVIRELLSNTCCRYLSASISSAVKPLSGCLSLIVRKFPDVSSFISKYLEGIFLSFDHFTHPAQI